MRISFLQRDQIDVAKWDSCIANSPHGLIYAQSWYLDVVASSWDALIADDYSAVFPLPYRVKYGIKYVYQPFFCQQLGVFSYEPLSQEEVLIFLNAIPKNFKYISINLNQGIRLACSNIESSERITYNLKLIDSYSSIVGKYNSNTKRNIAKANRNALLIKSNVEASEFLEMIKSDHSFAVYRDHFDTIKNLVHQAISRDAAIIYGAYNPIMELYACALFLRTNDRLIYLVPVSSTMGKDKSAMFAIIDHVVREYSQTGMILDFEGSSIESIARFYRGFGSHPLTFNSIIVNRLHWIVRIFNR